MINHGDINANILKRMNKTICYRGPDDEGYWIETVDSIAGDGLPLQIGLAHNRLSVLDLSALGHQPMTSQDGRITVCYNGEIYNYREIREELMVQGYSFQSDCDTEVILYAYEAWGIDCVSRLNGMFALALWDKEQRAFYLVRDRMGVKPLYYYLQEDILIFGSELKPIMAYPGFSKKLNLRALSVYLSYQYITGPESIFQDTWKLEPGHILRLQIDEHNHFQIEDMTYWSVEQAWNDRPKWALSYPDAKKRLHELLLDAVQLRLISDVPVGAFLSGGYDSTLIAALMQVVSGSPIKTFTIGFQEKAYDESTFANQVAKHLGTEHTCQMLTMKDAQRYIDRIPEFYDEPMADASQIAMMLLSRITREQVTVALSGDAGDELFCGYNKYSGYDSLHKRYRKISQLLKLADFVLPLRDKLREMDLRKFSKLFYMDSRSNLINADALVYWERYAELLPAAQRLPDKYCRMPGLATDPAMSYMLTDMVTYLPDDILVKVDRASMSVSLEARSPLLDYRVVEAALSLPMAYKFQAGIKKRILKDIAYEYVPRSLLDRPKQGFGVPVTTWMQADFSHFTRGLLEDEYIRRQGLFSPTVVQRMVKGFQQGKDAAYGRDLWTLLVFQMWWERYMH